VGSADEVNIVRFGESGLGETQVFHQTRSPKEKHVSLMLPHMFSSYHPSIPFIFYFSM